MVFTDVVEQRGVSMVDSRNPCQDQTPERLPNPPALSGVRRRGHLMGGSSPASKPEATNRSRWSRIRSSRVLSRDCPTPKYEPYWLPDSRRMIFSKALGVLSVADSQTGAVRDIFSRPGEDFMLAAVSHDGRSLYLLRRSRQADIWMATLK